MALYEETLQREHAEADMSDSKSGNPNFLEGGRSRAVDSGEERYAAVLTVTAALDEAYQIGEMAATRPIANMEDWSRFSKAARRPVPPFNKVESLRVPREEKAPLSEVLHFLGDFDRQWRVFGPKVAPLSQKLSAVLATLTRG